MCCSLHNTTSFSFYGNRILMAHLYSILLCLFEECMYKIYCMVSLTQ